MKVAENQLHNVNVSPVERSADRQQSEVQPEVMQRGLSERIPANLNLEELVDTLTTENFKGERVSPETVAAYRQSLMLVMEGNLLQYEEELQPEIQPQNTALSSDNQHITPTPDSFTSRQKSEVLASLRPIRLRA
jgi:hypothetical protein